MFLFYTVRSVHVEIMCIGSLAIKFYFGILKEYFIYKISFHYYKKNVDVKKKLLGITELRRTVLTELPNLLDKGYETPGSRVPEVTGVTCTIDPDTQEPTPQHCPPGLPTVWIASQIHLKASLSLILPRP